jgi:hypothetical protein
VRFLSAFRRRRPLIATARAPSDEAMLSPQQQAESNYARLHRADMARERLTMDNR